jgi:hypothetical protein
VKARYASKPLKLAAKVKINANGEVGYVTRMGLLRMKRGGPTKVDVYFPDRKARGLTFMSQRLYLANFLKYDGSVPEAEVAEPEEAAV